MTGAPCTHKAVPGGRGRALTLTALLALILAGLTFLAPAASADLGFCPPGSEAGQCEEPRGVAVDREDELVYVADRGNDRINVFDTEGVFQTSFGPPQLEKPMEVAVDNSGGASDGDVYVVDGSRRMLKFKPTGEFVKAFGTSGECQINGGRDPVAVGPGGVVYVADSEQVGPEESGGFFNRIEEYDEAGNCLKEVELFKSKRPLIGLAVDSSEDIYVSVDGSGIIRKYDPSGTLLYELSEAPEEASYLGIDGADHLFAAEREGRLWVIAEYNAAGKTLRRFGYDVIQRRLQGIAPFHSSAGEVFGSEEEAEVKYFTLPPPGPVVPLSTVEAAPVSNTKATLKAMINPEGKETKYHFEYVDQEGLKKSTPVESIAMEAGSEFRLHSVEAKIGCPNPALEAPEGKCLKPGTGYHFQVIAENADGEDEGEGEFETKPPFEAEIYATEVGVDTATLHAEVNPLGIPTTGHFEYVEEAKFKASGFTEATRIPAAEIDFGSGEAPVLRSATIFPLTPGTTYRYRLLAEDPLIEPSAPEERTLATFAPLKPAWDGPCGNEAFRAGPGAFLADCRAYEMVSPLDKNNSDILPLKEALTGQPAALNQSSLSGDRLTYSTGRAFGDALSAPFSVQYVAARDAGGGWQSHAISPPRGTPLEPSGVQADTEFKAFSPDLCNAWIRTVAEPVLAPGAVARFPNLYRRGDAECGGVGFEALTTVTPLHEMVKNSYPARHYISLELEGLSADGGEAIYVVRESLADAPAQPAICVTELETEVSTDGIKCPLRLYQYSSEDQTTHYVCILPGGVASKAPCGAGRPIEGSRSRENRLDNAISADGSRVFWTSFVGDPSAGKIYMRQNPSAEQGASFECSASEPGMACTVAVSKQGEEESGASASTFWGAAKDGSKAFFTAEEEGRSDLYEFDVDKKTTTPIAHEVTGVMGASEDASYIYFASKEALDTGAVAGKQNLYLYHSGSFKLVARLADADSEGSSGVSPLAREPRTRLSRVSPDGLHTAFTSFGRLTGYDNTDAVSGKADTEVYLYDASANGGEGKLLCASCNPSGARPEGRVVKIGGSIEIQAAALIPVWENTLHAQRVLSDDGSRLYFTSSDTLFPRDTNGIQDVYQWEAAGAGGCDLADPGFAPSSEGCLSLISSGKSDSPSEFVDSSPSGNDVFFSTLSALVSQDYGLVDIYDARVGGGFPPPPGPPAPCEGESCQSLSSPPNDPTPASESFRGAGDPTGSARSCRKSKVHRKGRCVPRKHHRRAHKAKRANRNGRAGR